MSNSNLVGTGILLQLFAKRDRWMLPVWILLPAILIIGHSFTFTSMTAGTTLQNMLEELNADTLVMAVHGSVMSMDLAGAVLWRSISQVVLILGIASFLTIIRHTRNEEESGRSELIRSLIVGKYANLTAALLITTIGNLLSGIFITLAMLFLGGNFLGSFLYGITAFFIGCFFASLAALAVQLKESSKSARAIGIAAIGISIIGNIINNAFGSDTFFKWISPSAWVRITEPFARNNPLGLLYFLMIISVIYLLSYLLSTQRDINGGILPSKAGREEAKPSFSSPLALAWRTQRESFFGWLLGMGIFIYAFATISPTLSGGISDLFANLGGENWMEGLSIDLIFVNMGGYIMSLLLSIFAILSMSGLKQQEEQGRTEMILDKKISRFNYMGSFLLVSALGSACLLFLMGIIGGTAYSVAIGEFGTGFESIFLMSISKIPPVWILLGVYSLLYGFSPKLSSIAWGVWCAFLLLEIGWESQVIDWSIMRFSPFATSHYTLHVHDLSLIHLSLLFIISIILAICGIIGFQKRDILTKP